MVRTALLALGLLATAPAATAQTVDWRMAGGGLFAGDAEVSAPSAQPLGEVPPPRLPPIDQPFQQAIALAAERHGLDPKLLHSLVLVESGYRPDAVSPAGAAGLTQLMPATAAELGVADRFDPHENLAGGADYLARQMLRFGDLRLALAAFNAGPGRVAALGRIPDIAETQAYVAAVIECYLALSAGRRVLTLRACQTSGSSR